ncbi:hypothetical protein GGX14DRAFT_577251 [Mycena pura]|uniref:DUF6533 domain-containing protein n=1 Tax=Mycena pura TaxID=153505 RepID=A0AAD6USD8_9AGAR|nr:hypothetical protein GGX14DRAFT_577251 [Mycena pura]
MAGEVEAGLAAWRLQMVKYSDMAAIALLFFDYFLTLNLEKTLVWPSRWSISKILFVFSRYLPFVEVPLCVYYIFALRPSSASCQAVNSSVISERRHHPASLKALNMTRSGSAHRNFHSRSYPPSADVCPEWPESALPANFHASLGVSASIVTLSIFIRGSEYDAPPLDLPGCDLVGGTFIFVGVPFIVITLFEMSLMSYTLWLGIQTYRHSASPMVVTLYRDGILYFVFLSAMSICNLVVLVAGPAHMQDLLNGILRVLHAIFSCRIILHVREVERTRQDATYTHGTDVYFATLHDNDTDHREQVEQEFTGPSNDGMARPERAHVTPTKARAILRLHTCSSLPAHERL